MQNFTPNPQNQWVDFLEETIKILAHNTLQFQQSVIQSLNANTRSIEKLEYTVSQLANSLSSKDKETFSIQPEANPRGEVPKNPIEINDLKGKGHKHVKSITTLRSGH